MLNDGLMLALVGMAFCLGVACTLAAQRLFRRQARPGPRALVPEACGTRPPEAASRRPAEPMPALLDAEQMALPPDPTGAASTIRGMALRITAERIPVSWAALLICPPDRPVPATWHVHLAPTVVLAYPDGRTIPVSAPSPTRRWTLAGGRIAAIADGGSERPITHESVTMQVTGPYLKVTLAADTAGVMRITASTFGDTAGPSEVRADASDSAAIVGALRQAVELSVSGRMIGAPPTVAYSRTAWDAHERIWLDVRAG